MKRLKAKLIGGLVGAAAGAAISPAWTAITIALDAVAPASYPTLGVGGALAAGMAVKEASGDSELGLLVGAAFYVGVLCLIPAAPLILISRPVTAPAFIITTGAAYGAFLGDAIAESKELKETSQ